MDLNDKAVVVTGGASGIGRALCHRFAREGARGVVVADLDGAGAATVADAISAAGGTALAVSTDVAVEADVVALVDKAIDTYGPIDLFCANAGIAISGSVDAPDEAWQRIWEINVMAHVYSARAVLPAMVERGGGYLLHPASAAGLLTNDSMVVSCMREYGLSLLATNDADFERVAGVTVFKPTELP